MTIKSTILSSIAILSSIGGLIGNIVPAFAQESVANTVVVKTYSLDNHFSTVMEQAMQIASDIPLRMDDEDKRQMRAERLDDYFEKRAMPLYGYGRVLVDAAEKYSLDWRLVAAIGVRESSGGKHMMNNNPFGWGSAKIKFDDFEEAIETVSAHLGGGIDSTSSYYKDKTTLGKLWAYNGTVLNSYPAEVVGIMNKF